MTTPERRQVARTALERLAYIQIEPDNGGIVVNVSGEGLCYHAVSPVEGNKPLCFSLFDHDRSIDACGELVWTDKTHKFGGLRFTTLTPEARGHIDNWIKRPAVPPEEKPAAKPLSPLPEEHASAPLVTEKTPRLKFALSAAVQDLVARRSNGKAEMSLAPRTPPPVPGKRLTGFTAGLTTGLVISALAVLIFFALAQRRELGESLIRLGGRLAAEPVQRQTTASKAEAPNTVAPVVAAAAVATPQPTSTGTPDPEPALNRPESAARPEQPVPRAVEPEQPRLNAEPEVIVSRPAVGPVRRPHRVAGSGEMSAPPALLAGALPLPAATLVPNAVDLLPRSDGANTVLAVGITSTRASSQMFFDLGRFKDEFMARDISARVRRLGLRTIVAQKKRLWTDSYQVLVPYGNEDEETRIRNSLVSHGYPARPFERGSRDFEFRSLLTVRGSPLPVGEFTITWESYIADARVKFDGRNATVTAAGTWMKRPNKYTRDEYVYLRNKDGSKTLLEIHFSGLDRALVFGRSS